jgi:hypothetical protein
MATKRKKSAKNPPVKPLMAPSPEKRTVPWKKLLLMFTMAPIVLGGLFIFAALMDILVLGSIEVQAVLGVLCMLAGFVASNALQNQWTLMIGWLLLGIAVVLWLYWGGTWVRGVAYVVGGVGLVFLAKEFVERYQQNQPKTKS